MPLPLQEQKVNGGAKRGPGGFPDEQDGGEGAVLCAGTMMLQAELGTDTLKRKCTSDRPRRAQETHLNSPLGTHITIPGRRSERSRLESLLLERGKGHLIFRGMCSAVGEVSRKAELKTQMHQTQSDFR